MRVTVCQLRCDSPDASDECHKLLHHAASQRSDLVLLPEMPFSPWLADSPDFDLQRWNDGVNLHVEWMNRLARQASLPPVITTRPINDGDRRINEAIAWSTDTGIVPLHQKAYLPNEDGCWESSWYHAGDEVFELRGVAQVRLGVLICTELWALDRAKAYGKAGAQMIAVPRATGSSTVSKWVVGGQACAIVSGSYCLSSNRVSTRDDHVDFGGGGWIIDPDGRLLALTNESEPFVTLELPLDAADVAKTTYPRYALP
jgi:predicted amidohydrolase